MLQQTQIALAAEFFGDLRPLIEQIGSPEGFMTLSGAAPMRHIGSAADLREFLRAYHTEILRPRELPATQRAFNHAARNELRELIAFDQELSRGKIHPTFVSASRRVGQKQLERLRPLHDHRLAQRYLLSVEKGEAQGWHTLVYGLTLAIYSIPLRQGLFGYAHQTTRGFIHSAARSLRLSEAESLNLVEEANAHLPAAVEALMTPIG